jgi:hypothetical protein
VLQGTARGKDENKKKVKKFVSDCTIKVEYATLLLGSRLLRSRVGFLSECGFPFLDKEADKATAVARRCRKATGLHKETAELPASLFTLHSS